MKAVFFNNDTSHVKHIHIIVNFITKLPRFSLLLKAWNTFTASGAVRAAVHIYMHKWGLRASEVCECGQLHATEYTVEEYSLHQFPEANL